MSNVALYLSYANVGQYEEASLIRKDTFFKGGAIVVDYDRLIYIVRNSIAKRFALSPNDPTLVATSEYLRGLVGIRTINQPPLSTAFIIVTQPQSQSINSGDTVSFSVVVAGGVPGYTYQWYYNNSPIGGATSSIYTITGATTGNAGNYKVIITDSAAHTLTSNTAVLSVAVAMLTADWWYGTDDPFPALSGGTDDLVYLGSVSFAPGANIVIPWPSASADNMFRVVRYPISESSKTNWVNTVGFNFGSIPGTAYNPIVTITTKKYIVSKGDSIFTPFIVTYS